MRHREPRRPLLTSATVLVLGLAATAAPGGADGQSPAAQATHSVTATATFGPWTSVEVSSHVLRFHVSDESVPTEAVVAFTAGARTRTNGEVLLVVEVADQGVEAQGAPGALAIVGGPEGTIAGAVARQTPTVAARWIGGGFRTGSVTFRLQAPPGQYRHPGQVPVTHSLTAALRAYGSRVTHGFSPMAFPTAAAAFTAS